MHKIPFEKYVVASGTLVLTALFFFWLFHDPVKDLSINLPGQDNRPSLNTGAGEKVIIGEKFTAYTDIPGDLQGKWPRFRGTDHDNINKESIPLLDSWQDQEPLILWEKELGEGHAAPVIYNGRVYILDYHEIKKADALRCFDLKTGEELWRRWYNVHVKRNHGMSRTVPAIFDHYIVTIGPRGHVMCTDLDTGDFLWGIDLVEEYQTEIPFWYTGQCPLIDKGIAVIAPGGNSLLIGVDCASGKVLWQTPNEDGWKMSHSSVMPMVFENKKMYVYAAVGGICGVSAESSDMGKILWKTSEFAPNVVAPSPLILENGKIFMTAGYGAGAMLFRLEKTNGGFGIRILQKYKPNEGLASEQQTPVFRDGMIYAVLPKDAGSMRNQFVCCKTDDCRKFIWSSGKSDRFGLGPYIFADGKFYILSDNGTLTIARADANGFRPLDRRQIIDGQDAWGPLAIADGYLLMRDSKKMVCLDIREK